MLVELAPFVVLAVVLLLFGLLLRHGMTIKRRMLERARAVAAAAETRGYRPDRAGLEAVRTALLEMPRFSGRRLEVEALLARNVSGGRRFVIDYAERGGSGRSTTGRGTLFAAELGTGGLPAFALHGLPAGVEIPERFAARLERSVGERYPGFRAVELAGVFPGPPPCVAFAADPSAVGPLLAGGVARVLEKSPGWGLECTGSWLVAERARSSEKVRPDARTTAADLADFESIADALGG